MKRGEKLKKWFRCIQKVDKYKQKIFMSTNKGIGWRGRIISSTPHGSNWKQCSQCKRKLLLDRFYPGKCLFSRMQVCKQCSAVLQNRRYHKLCLLLVLLFTLFNMSLAIAQDIGSISLAVSKSSPTKTDALSYQVEPGTWTKVQMWRPDGSSYILDVFVTGERSRVPYKIKWLGFPYYQMKFGTTYYTYRDTNTIMGLREDGFIVYKTTP